MKIDSESHKFALSVIGEMNYELLSESTKNLVKKEKKTFLKYKRWSRTGSQENRSQDNKVLGDIAQKIIKEFGIYWPKNNSERPYLCLVLDMDRDKVSGVWKWKLKKNFLKFLNSIDD